MIPPAKLATNIILDKTNLPEGISAVFLQKVSNTFISEAGGVVIPGAIEISFVDRRVSRKLNRDFAGNDYPTDVLSFPYSTDALTRQSDDVEFIAGEIVICTPIAKSQATSYATDLKSEVALLVVHGLLHISGQDHQTASQKASFTSIQDGIMEKLNLKSRTLW